MTTPLFKGNSGPIASIVNFFSSGGTASTQSISASYVSNMKEKLYGSAMTANTLYEFYSFTGRGRLNALSAYTIDSTARTIRVKVTIDGTVIYDATSSSISTSGYGVVPVGVVSNSGALVFQPVEWQTSCLIEVATSVTETDKVATGINYETWL